MSIEKHAKIMYSFMVLILLAVCFLIALVVTFQHKSMQQVIERTQMAEEYKFRPPNPDPGRSIDPRRFDRKELQKMMNGEDSEE